MIGFYSLPAKLLRYYWKALQESRQQLGYVEGTLQQLQGQLHQWQQEKDIYQQWDEDPQTQLMREKVEQLQEPDMQERLQQLQLAYGLYGNCVKVLERFGVEEEGIRVFKGQRYRFESEGQHLRLFRHGEKQPIFQTMDIRQLDGILEVQQLDVRPDDYQQIDSGVRLLDQRAHLNRNLRFRLKPISYKQFIYSTFVRLENLRFFSSVKFT